jgi:periplasmic protein TonB
MKLKNLSPVAVSLFLLIGCNNNASSPNAEVKSDTSGSAAPDQQPTAPPPPDNTATAKHKEAHAKVKGTYIPEDKTHSSGKKTVVDSDPVILHHESTAEEKQDADGYYYNPKVWAAFPGGEEAFDKFLSRNLEYPDKAVENEIEGTVYVSLYVDESGNVVNAVMPGTPIGYGLEEEVTRVIKKMPKWNPAKNDDKGVKSKFTVPIRFMLRK